MNGNTTCAGSGAVSCQTINGRTTCVSGNGGIVQQFGGTPAPTPPTIEPLIEPDDEAEPDPRAERPPLRRPLPLRAPPPNRPRPLPPYRTASRRSPHPPCASARATSASTSAT